MTDAELLKLKPSDLVSALSDKETIAQLRADGGLLAHVIEALPGKQLADALVKNKYAPKEAVAHCPMAFIDSFIEYNFNPGTDGILELCQLSQSEKMDAAIARLVRAFPTNKYDAGFIRSVMNLSSASEDSALSEVLSFLMRGSGVAPILLKALKEENPAAFIGVLERLSGGAFSPSGLRASASFLTSPLSTGLIDHDFVAAVAGDGDRVGPLSLRLFKLIYKLGQTDLYGGRYGSSPFTALLADKSTNARITDDEAVCYVRKSPLAYQSEKIIYRKAYEALDKCGLESNFSGVPRDSRFFLSSFASGNESLGAADAYLLLGERQPYSGTFSSRARMRASLLAQILRSGEASEMATQISSSPELLTSYIASHSVTPAVLRDAIGREREAVASAILPLVGSEFKKQIRSNYAELKTKGGRVSITETHELICNIIKKGDAAGFLDAIADYEPGASSIAANINAFLARHEQTSYRSKYEDMSMCFEFLARLGDEDVALQLALSPIRLRGKTSELQKGFLSAKNALAVLRENGSVSESDCLLSMTYEKEAFLALLDREQVAKISFYDPKKKKIAALVGLAASQLVEYGAGLEPIELNSDEILAAAALLVTKKECRKMFSCEPLGHYGYDGHAGLVFKGGERYTDEEIVKSAIKTTARPEYVLEALEKIGAKERLSELCQAIIAPKPDAFKAILPYAGIRTAELRNKATAILAGLGSGLVSMADVLKKNTHLSSLKKTLGDSAISLLLKHEPEKKLAIVLDSAEPKIERAELEALKAKYDLSATEVNIGSAADLGRLKDLVFAGVPIAAVDLSLLELKKKANQAIFLEAVEACAKQEGLRPQFGDNLLRGATLEGCVGILRAFALDELFSAIDDVESLKLAHQLQIPFSSSISVATSVASDADMLRCAIKEGIAFDDLVVALEYEYAYERVQKLVKPARAIGLTILSEGEHRLYEVAGHVFGAAGEIMDFEPVALKGLSMGDRVELVQKLMAKNPKYKKLLGQDLGSDQFVLNPPRLLDKGILTVANLKEVLGFGAPGDMTKEQKDSLSDLIVASGSLIALASQNIKNFLSLVGLNEVKFEDVLERQGQRVAMSAFGAFMGTDYKQVGEDAKQVFASVLKNPSKAELFALVRDQSGGYSMDYLRDSVRALADARSEINHFIAVLGEDNISASLIFAAMAGDSAANAILDERMSQGDDAAEMLKSLSASVKRVTVEVSIARKQAKAGESASLATTLHDSLGGLVATISRIVKDKGEAKKNKMKTGFEKYNEYLASDAAGVTSKSRAKPYALYFPENLGEVKDVGSRLKWCTSYNDSYFEETIGGSAVLFNLKDGESIVAQGFLKKGPGGKWVMNQLRWAHNTNAMDSFEPGHLIGRINELIKKDQKLAERYLVD